MSDDNSNDDLNKAYRAAETLGAASSAPRQTTRDRIAQQARSQIDKPAANQPFWSMTAVASVMGGVLLGAVVLMYWPRIPAPQIATAPASVTPPAPATAPIAEPTPAPIPTPRPLTPAPQLKTDRTTVQDKKQMAEVKAPEIQPVPQQKAQGSNPPKPALNAEGDLAIQVAESTVAAPLSTAGVVNGANMKVTRSIVQGLRRAIESTSSTQLAQWIDTTPDPQRKAEVNTPLPNGELPLTAILRSNAATETKLTLIKQLLAIGADARLKDQFKLGTPQSALEIVDTIDDDRLKNSLN